MANIVNRNKYYGTLATIGVVGGISVLAFVLLKKPKLKVTSIDEIRDGDKLISKKYNIKLGLRDLQMESTPFNTDEIKLNLPLFTYTFKTVNVLDEDGFQKIEVLIKNRVNSKEKKYFLNAL
jgi:hypothetical protein